MKHRIGKSGKPVESKRAAGILFTDGESILLLKRKGDCTYTGTWALPGGKNKDGETDIGAAIRETKEETGISEIPGYRFESLTSQDGHKKFTTFLYRVRKPFDVSLSFEHSDWKWVKLKELDEYMLHPKMEENMPRYLSALHRKVGTFSEWLEAQLSTDARQ